MHVSLSSDGKSVFATCGRQSDGVIAELDASNGALLNVLELPFRGARLLPLDKEGSRFLVESADTAQLAVVEWQSQKILAILDLPFASRHYRVALSPRTGLLAISGRSQICCYRADQIHLDLPDPLWTTDKASGFINRLIWTSPSDDRLIASTVGSAAEPERNGLYLFENDGQLLSTHILTTRSQVGLGNQQASVRDIRMASLMHGDGMDIVAVADDSRLYVWRPG